MASIVVRGLLATLLLAGADIAAAQAMHVRTDVATPVASLASSGMGLAALPVSDAYAGSLATGAEPVIVAAVSAPSEFVIARTARKPESATTGGSGTKSWVLVALGIFLMVTVSQRRVTSMMD